MSQHEEEACHECHRPWNVTRAASSTSWVGYIWASIIVSCAGYEVKGQVPPSRNIIGTMMRFCVTIGNKSKR